jgi:hypothetical protein
MTAGDKQCKIITALQERRRIEEAIRQLAHLSLPKETEEQARRIANMGDQVLPTLTSLLDTSNPRFLGALGLVAAHMDRQEIAPALHDVAAWSGQSDRVRLAAMLILEQFLGQELDESLYAGLRSPEETVAQSLVEMVDQATQDRDILQEYVRAIEQQSDDVIALVFDIVGNLGPERAVLPFWALAQSECQDVAELALRHLGSLRSPASAIMLQALLPTLSPTRRPVAERSLRKLQFSGVNAPLLCPPQPSWRSLVSPIDSRGYQSVWFLFDPSQDAPVQMLSVLLNNLTGIQNVACDHDGELAQCLPSERRLGMVHQVVFPGAPAALPLLETTFDAGRHLVREALAAGYAQEREPPLNYATLSDALWKWEIRQGEEWPQLDPPSAAEVAASSPHVASLLDHVAFETWFVQSEALSRVVREVGWRALFRRSPEGAALLDDLIRWHFSPEAIARYCRWLERMAGWLWLAGEAKMARLALVAAITLEEIAPENHPLAQHMVVRGIAIALREMGLE